MRNDSEKPVHWDCGPDELTPEDRLRELAIILARGIMRLRVPNSPPEIPADPLDLTPNPVLSVDRG